MLYQQPILVIFSGREHSTGEKDPSFKKQGEEFQRSSKCKSLEVEKKKLQSRKKALWHKFT